MTQGDDLNQPFDVLLTDAAGVETDGVIRIYGAGSAQFLKIQNEQKWRILKPTKRAGHFELHMKSAEDIERDEIELLAGCTVSWNLARDGEPIECTPETAAEIYGKYYLARRDVH